jgi:hypothetical protein
MSVRAAGAPPLLGMVRTRRRPHRLDEGHAVSWQPDYRCQPAGSQIGGQGAAA